MKQSRTASLIESGVSTAAGFGLSIALQSICLPLMGVPIPWQVNFYFAGIMTVASVARQFVLRRVFEALHIRVKLSPFALAVIAERQRQIAAEGWSAEHDAGHQPGELATAGAAYALADTDDRGFSDIIWPWAQEWWKPTDLRRNLVKATALLMAEGDKFDAGRKRRAG